MTAADWTPIINALIALIGLVLTTFISIYVPKALAAFQARTGIQLTEQQQKTVMDSALIAKGVIETKLDQGLMTISDIHAGNPAVIAAAQDAVARVPPPPAAAAKESPGSVVAPPTANSMAQMIVGLVDTSPKPAVVAVPVAARSAS